MTGMGITMNQNVIVAKDISKSYQNGPDKISVIQNLSLEIAEKEIIAVVGPSGSGKSTLLNILSSIDTVDSGSIFMEGKEITGMKGNALNRFRREKLGFIFQDFNLLDTLTAYENIALPLSIQNVAPLKIDAKIGELTERLGIGEVMKKYPYQMSGGQKQRVAAARALIGDPALVLADEPTGALDSKSARSLLESMEGMNQNYDATILMVTHDAMAASFTTRVIFLKDGQIFNEVRRGTDTRKQFFDRIMDVVTLIGGAL